MSSIIRLSGVSKTYRTKEIETQALENVNLEVGKGEFMSIMGLPDAESPHCSTLSACSTSPLQEQSR